ncbi:MAG: hypothetical protein J7647_04920 [Cyanobacteria bacterium SBLK]|nr:hypothetical protein [Cyanobacteria bacterium SBLK]
MMKTISKIETFQTYPQGWSFGEGKKFKNKIIRKAIDLVRFSYKVGFREMDAFPGLNGEVMVTLYLDREYWEFTIESEESVTFVYEYDDEMILCKENLSFNNILRKIKNIAIDKFVVPSYKTLRSFNNQLCGSLEFSTSNIMTLESKDLRVWHSNLLPMEESLFFIKNVSCNKNKQSVRILENTTHLQPVANQQFSGNLNKIYSPKNVN